MSEKDAGLADRSHCIDVSGTLLAFVNICLVNGLLVLWICYGFDEYRLSDGSVNWPCVRRRNHPQKSAISIGVTNWRNEGRLPFPRVILDPPPQVLFSSHDFQASFLCLFVCVYEEHNSSTWPK